LEIKRKKKSLYRTKLKEKRVWRLVWRKSCSWIL